MESTVLNGQGRIQDLQREHREVIDSEDSKKRDKERGNKRQGIQDPNGKTREHGVGQREEYVSRSQASNNGLCHQVERIRK